MADLPTRLLIAYGLIGLVVLAGTATALWRAHKSRRRRRARQRPHAPFRAAAPVPRDR